MARRRKYAIETGYQATENQSSATDRSFDGPRRTQPGSEFAIAKGGKGNSMKSFIDFELSLCIVNYECVERRNLDQES